MTKRGKMKNVYVLKSTPEDIDEKHKELDTKNVYLLKEDDEALSRYRDTVYAFVDDQDGLFLVLSHDKSFFNTFRNSFYKELRIDQERIRLMSSPKRGLEEIRVYREYQKTLFFLSSPLSTTDQPFLSSRN